MENKQHVLVQFGLNPGSTEIIIQTYIRLYSSRQGSIKCCLVSDVALKAERFQQPFQELL